MLVAANILEKEENQKSMKKTELPAAPFHQHICFNTYNSPTARILYGMGLLILLFVINLMMMVGHYPMPQGVSLAGLCLPVVGALAVDLGMNPIVVCLPVCMSTSMLLLVPIDPTCYTTYSGGYWKIKDMMGTGVIITLGYVLVSTIWITAVASMGLLG